MSSSLYLFTVLSIDAAIVRFRLTIINPDVTGFGTDRLFAWRLLAEHVSPDDDSIDELADAEKYVTRVELSPVEDAKVVSTSGYEICVKPSKKKQASVVYTVTVSDAALLADLEPDLEDETTVYVDDEASKALAARASTSTSTSASADSGTRRFEVTEGGSKFWQVRMEGDALHIDWGKIGTKGQSQTKEFASAAKARAEGDKLIAEKLKKGYVEVGAAAAPAPAKKAAAAAPKASAPKAGAAKAAAPKGKPKPSAPVTERTFDEFREETLRLIEDGGFLMDEVGAAILQWAGTATDEQSVGWVQACRDDEGFRSWMAGRLACLRLQNEQTESAKRFIALGEKALKAATEPWYRAQAWRGMIPAWWQIGERARAEEAFGLLAKFYDDKPDERLAAQRLLALAAAGRQRKKVDELLPAAMKTLEKEGVVEIHDELLGALPEMWNSELEPVFHSIMTVCEARKLGQHSGLARALFARTSSAGQPERFLELALQYPVVLHRGGFWYYSSLALAAVERRSPKDAVAHAEALLKSEETPSETQHLALAILTAHQPAAAARWATKNASLLAPQKSFSHLPYLAALGRNDEVSKALPKVPEDSSSLYALARITTDRALAVAALTKHVASSITVWLIDLGAADAAETLVQKRLAELKAEPAGYRDLGCRQLASVAAMCGLRDLARATTLAPTKSDRQYSAAAWLAGAAAIGDWTSAYEALSHIPEQNRYSQMVQSGLRAVIEGVEDGPRAMSPRSA